MTDFLKDIENIAAQFKGAKLIDLGEEDATFELPRGKRLVIWKLNGKAVYRIC